MKMLISCLLKSTVYIKYFGSNFLEKLSILKETLQIKIAQSEEGHNPLCYGNWKCSPNLLLAKQTFVLFFFSFRQHEIVILMFNMFIHFVYMRMLKCMRTLQICIDPHPGYNCNLFICRCEG
jgi:hypothetical protein